MTRGRPKSAPRAIVRRTPELTRAKLLEAAKTLFAQHGLHGVSVSEIAQAAGVSVAMINHHFGGKDGLYRTCVHGFGVARLEALDRLLVAPTTQAELALRLEILVTEMLELHVQDFEMCTILLRDANAAEHWGPEVEQTVYSFSTKLATFFALARDHGLLRKDVDPMTPASVVYLSLSGLLQVDAHRARVTGASLREPAHRKKVVKRLLDLVLRGICADRS